MDLKEFTRNLVCPTTGEELTLTSSTNKEYQNFIPIKRKGGSAIPIGLTDQILVNPKKNQAYPIVDGFPVLMAPELLVNQEELNNYETIDLKNKKYAEAYEEMDVYNKANDGMIDADDGSILEMMGALTPNFDFSKIETVFPDPENVWVDAKHDAVAQLEAYSYISPVANKTFVQLGGSGSHAVKALIAGAEKAFVLTPMLGEARVTMEVAKRYGVADRIACVIAVGEELPFKENSLDMIYSGGCFHHMRLDYASKELFRVLKKGGKFSGVDPWKTPLHTIGTSIIGKREKSVFCKPITPERLAPMKKQFKEMVITHHGPVLRYLFLAFEKAKLDLSISSMFKISRIDDSIGKATGLIKYGGSIMIAGKK